MEFSRPEYCSGQSFPSPGDLPNPAIKPRSPTLQADSLPAETQGKTKNTGVRSLFLLMDFPHPEIELGSLALQVDSLATELLGKPFILSGARQIKEVSIQGFTLNSYYIHYRNRINFQFTSIDLKSIA